MNYLRFKDKIVLITGGTRGIGRAIARRFASEGATLILNYRGNCETAAEAEANMREFGVRCMTIQANVGNPKHITHMFDEIQKNFGRLDILITNAALGVQKPALEIKDKHWDLTFDISVRSLLLCAQQAVPLMKKGGHIVSVSSIGSQRYAPNYAALGSAKAAMESLTRYLAVELAPRNILVNAVAAGTVETEALRAYPSAKEMIEKQIARAPIKRMGMPKDIAGVVAFLCSPDASWICGQTIVVDGGLSLPLY